MTPPKLTPQNMNGTVYVKFRIEWRNINEKKPRHETKNIYVIIRSRANNFSPRAVQKIERCDFINVQG